jgi:hypothetical protein
MCEKSGRIRSMPGCSTSGTARRSRRRAAAGVLEDRHVAADLAEAAERDDAQAAVASGGGGPSSGCGVAHASATPCGVRSCASTRPLLLGGVDERQAHGPDRRALQRERGLGEDDALGAEHAAVDRLQLQVELAGPRDVARVEGAHHLDELRRDDVADDAHHADAADGQQRQVELVGAGVDGQAGLAHEPGRGAEVVLGVLDRDDLRVLRQRLERRGAERHAGAAGMS